MTYGRYLFRKEVFTKLERVNEGSISLVQAKHTVPILCVLGLVVLPLIAGLIWGSYTKRTTVGGVTTQSRGTIRIIPNPQGTVFAVHAQEGERVKKGQKLYTINDARRLVDGEGSSRFDQSLSTNREFRREKVSQSIGYAKEVQSSNQLNKSQRLASLREQANIQRDEVELITRRIRNGEETVAKFVNLVNQKYFTQDALREKQDLVFSMKAQLLAAQRQLIETNRIINQTVQEYVETDLRLKTQIGELSGQLSVLEREGLEDEMRTKYTIVAPEDGIVTGASAYEGQQVGGKPIATLMPENSEIHVHLYASSKAMGFIKVGQLVKLRYQAFPYQKYGQFDGVVNAISLAPIDAADLPIEHQSTHEDKYRISVVPKKQKIEIDEEEINLISGMMVDANIYQEKRRLYQWMLDPLKVLSHTF